MARAYRPCRSLAVLSVVALSACATPAKQPPRPEPATPVDLGPARRAVASAREAGATERAPEEFARAQGHLNEAEALASGPAEAEERERSMWLGRLAIAEAECASQIARQAMQQNEQKLQASQEVEKRKRQEQDQRRLEEELASLRRELDFAETEVIRTKARLKGIETRADASSAIAEGRILLSRLDGGPRSALLQSARDAMERAERLLHEENYGAAVYFAQKAQDIALKARDQRAAPPQDRPADQPGYVVRVATANLRSGPDTSQAVVARLPRGTKLNASVARGEWIRVEHAGVTGWIHRSVVE